ncbi:MAG: 1-phosphofructokinase [Clostridia bacterium]|nr:1-phosphofructokinase [Clostridia bacterium]
MEQTYSDNIGIAAVYTVTLNPALDYFLSLNRLKADEICRADAAELRCGGKGVNVSMILSRLGVANTALGFVAGKTGVTFTELLKNEGIEQHFIRLKNGQTRINVKISGQKEYAINAPGPCAGKRDLTRLISRLRRAQKGDFVVLSGAPAKGLDENVYAEIMRRCKDRELRFVVDASGAYLKNALAHRPYLTKPNLPELAEYAGTELKSEEQILKAARLMQEEGAQNVLVTLGAQGAMLLDDRGKTVLMPAVKKKIRSTVGCGDSMIAGFLAGIIRGCGREDALVLGTACAAATAAGGKIADADTIRNYCEMIKNDRILK